MARAKKAAGYRTTARQPPVRAAAWELHLLRATTFYRQPSVAVEGLLQRIANVQPRVSTNPASGIHVEQIENAAANYELLSQQQPLRSDIGIVGGSKVLPQFGNVADPTPTFPSFRDAAAVLRPLIEEWCQSRPDVYRVAVGATFRQLAADRDGVAALLSRWIPGINLTGNGVDDFILRINRPSTVRAGTQSVPLNRVMTYSGLVIQLEAMLASAVRVTVPSVKLELDLSTDVFREEVIQGRSLSGLFAQLFDETPLLAERGIPND